MFHRRATYLGLNRFVVGKPLGATFPAAARLPSHSRHSGQVRLRPPQSVQAAPSGEEPPPRRGRDGSQSVQKPDPVLPWALWKV
jgi:hypothetical protein